MPEIAASAIYHFTDADGFKAISSQPEWVFKVSKPPGDHPEGAYFTTLPPTTRNLPHKLRLPRRKTAHFFAFVDNGDLEPLPGGRGKYILFSRSDYHVVEARQIECK